MLQIQTIRKSKEEVIIALQKRNFTDANIIIDKVLSLDQVKRLTQQKNEKILSEINVLSRKIGNLMKNNEKDEVENLRAKTIALKKASSLLVNELVAVDDELKNMLYHIPNVPNQSVPLGKGSENNVVMFESAPTPKMTEQAKPHWDLIQQYDIIDFGLGSKITGAGFPVYKGKGARLQRALINFFLDEAIKHGYIEIQPPILVNEMSGYGTGQLPDKESQMYHLEKDNLYLIPTAEVPITNLYRDVILTEKELPVKNVGHTPCFRREAGSWGAHVRGLNRLHQFDKVEIVQIVKPENSSIVLDEMCEYVQHLLVLLELPYRKTLLCGGDLGFNSTLTYDMEVYAGAQRQWLEVSSISNFETFQANRLKLRFKDKDGTSHLLHTLNGSALALPRIVAAIIENNQTEEGIRIPKALVPYTGFDTIN